MIKLKSNSELCTQKPLDHGFLKVEEAFCRIRKCIVYPLQKISELFSFQQKTSLAEKNISIELPIHVKTETETFNHRFFYALREGKVFFKPIGTNSHAPWKEIPFHKKAIYISANGNHLIVLDEEKKVYHTETKSIEFTITDHDWTVTSFQVNWQENWFRLKGISSIVNFLKPGFLYAMENARGVAISQRGAKNFPHRGTMLYMLNPSGNRIFFADTQLHTGFHNEITGPKNGDFYAESIDASSSTIFLFRRTRDREGRTSHKMYTRFADYNSIGANPLYSTAYPIEDWREQPTISLDGKACLTKQITIIQTGKEKADRELRVEGTNGEGHVGYYVKKIYDASWNFQQTGHQIQQNAFSIVDRPQEHKSASHNYAGWIETKEGKFEASLENFLEKGLTERGLHTLLEIKHADGKKTPCHLYAKKQAAHHLGLQNKQSEWFLFVPDKTSKLITSQQVKVIENPHLLVIQGNGFKAHFARVGEELKKPYPPHIALCALIKTALLLLTPIKHSLKLTKRIVDKISRNEKALIAQERFYQSLPLDNIEHTKTVLKTVIAKDPFLAQEAVVDFLCHSSVLPHIVELMNGANVLIEGENNRLLNTLCKLKGVQARHSSHEHQEGKSFGLESQLFGELLFWVDKQGKLRLQFEAHSLRNTFKLFYHIIDYLNYRLQGEQQGPYGTSKYTDASPLVIRM